MFLRTWPAHPLLSCPNPSVQMPTPRGYGACGADAKGSDLHMTIAQHPTIDNTQVGLHPLISDLPAGGEIPLYVPQHHKPVAGVSVRPDGQVELHKWIRASVHLVETPRGIAFDADLFRRACDLGAQVIRVRDVETGSTYECSVATFDRYAFAQDRQHGAQRFLKLQHWSIDGKPPEYTPPAARAAEPEGMQLGLFGGAA